jgi:hypothetical protein
MRVESRDQCLFCERRANSDEDIWPKWLLKAVGPRRLYAFRGGTAPRERKVGSLKFKARLVCRTCNNGWMSRLENNVRPVLTPMLQGGSALLRRRERHRLALWGVKMSMLVEHTLGGGPTYWTERERRAFAAPPHPYPPSTETFIGSYEGDQWRAMLQGKSADIFTLTTKERVAPMIGTIVLCNRVLLYVTADRYEETTGRVGWVWPPPHFGLVSELRPHMEGTLAWPNEIAFTNETLVEFIQGRRSSKTEATSKPQVTPTAPNSADALEDD